MAVFHLHEVVTAHRHVALRAARGDVEPGLMRKLRKVDAKKSASRGSAGLEIGFHLMERRQIQVLEFAPSVGNGLRSLGSIRNGSEHAIRPHRFVVVLFLFGEKAAMNVWQ